MGLGRFAGVEALEGGRRQRQVGMTEVDASLGASTAVEPWSAPPNRVDWEEPSPSAFERFPLISFAGLHVDGRANYLVKGLIPAVGVTVVWGPPKCGKSFWVADMVLRVALGWDYRGRKVKCGPVVYCAFEGAEGFRARAEAFRRHHLADDPYKPFPFYVMPASMQLVRDYGDFIASMSEQFGGTAPVAFVLDTLNRSLTGSESSDEDMSAYIQAADAIREAFDCAVIIVHHCGIDGSRPRGHTSLTGAADAQLSVKRDATKNIVVTVEFMKDGPEGEVVVSALDSVQVGIDQDGDPITSCVVVPVDGDLARAGSRIKMTGAAKVASDLLDKALIEAGEIGPPSNTIPAATRTIPLLLWRAYCETGMVFETDNPDSRRRQFARLVTKLQSLGVIGVHNERVWRADRAGQSRTASPRQ